MVLEKLRLKAFFPAKFSENSLIQNYRQRLKDRHRFREVALLQKERVKSIFRQLVETV